VRWFDEGSDVEVLMGKVATSSRIYHQEVLSQASSNHISNSILPVRILFLAGPG